MVDLEVVKASMMGRISAIPSELADKHAGVDKTTVSRCLLPGVRLGEKAVRGYFSLL